MKTIAVLLACAMLSFWPPAAARADIKVGDKPDLHLETAGNGQVSLAALHGKLVVIDFWATWCGPCMQETPHMVEVNHKYASQGLQMIGVSLDDSAAVMVQTAQEKGMTWPQYCDAQAGSPLSKAWQVNSIPRTFLFGPDGALLWTGHPVGLDAALADAFQAHPPQLVDPKVLADASTKLGEIEKAVDDHKAADAIKLMAHLPPEAGLDKPFAARLAEVSKKVDVEAQSMLAEIDPLIAARNYPEAAAKLQDLAQGLRGSEAGVAAKRKLNELEANPDARAALDKARREQLAAADLMAAQSLQASKKDRPAYARFKQLAQQYAGTAAAATAADAVKVYERDPAFVKSAGDAAASDKARNLLSLADSYRSARHDDAARAKYQAVIDQFPGTSFAATAKKALDDMGN